MLSVLALEACKFRAATVGGGKVERKKKNRLDLKVEVDTAG